MHRSLYNLFNLFHQGQYNLLLIRLTGRKSYGEELAKFKIFFVGRVFRPGVEGQLFWFLWIKKKQTKWLILWTAAQIATEMQIYVDRKQNPLTLAGFNQGAKRNIISRQQTTLRLLHRSADTFTNTSFRFEPWPDKWLLKSVNCPHNISLQFCGTSLLYNITFPTLVGSFSLRREWGCKLNYSCLKVVATDQG